ncbi:MAG TPA: hypothetical protein VFK02_33945 [Kofleriaceae bacterium]|nr:hypothetical protein [Kofleriaceae bacterium]
MGTSDLALAASRSGADGDGSGANDLNLKRFDISEPPNMDYDSRDRAHQEIIYPHMDGKRVFLIAARGTVMSSQAALALAKTGMGWNDNDWCAPGQPADPREGGRGREHPRATRC